MAWIPSYQTLSRHRKTLHAVGLLQVDRHKLIGHLHQFWWWAVDNAPQDGCLDGMNAFVLAGGAEWDGDPRAFVDALVEAGFLDRYDDGGLWLHEWDEYAGKLTERRDRERDRMQQKRANERRSPRVDETLQQQPTNVAPTTNEQPQNVEPTPGARLDVDQTERKGIELQQQHGAPEGLAEVQAVFERLIARPMGAIDQDRATRTVRTCQSVGMPLTAALEAMEEGHRMFEPTDLNPAIRDFRYFEGWINKRVAAWRDEQRRRKRGPPTGGGRHGKTSAEHKGRDQPPGYYDSFVRKGPTQPAATGGENT